MYEIVCGFPPYFSKDWEWMTWGIKQGQLEFPACTSEHFKSLVLSLIDKNPNWWPQSFKHIKSHKFFEEFDWIKIE